MAGSMPLGTFVASNAKSDAVTWMLSSMVTGCLLMIACWWQDGNCFLAGSVKHHVRLYDTRAHRRPVLHLKFGEARITALQPEINGVPIASRANRVHVSCASFAHLAGPLPDP